MTKNREIEITEFQKEGYKPLVDFGQWRVAVLKFCEDLRLESIKTMQKHQETDEVFVLLKGECTLFLGGSGVMPKQMTAVPMEMGRLYNIKQGVWHNHIMDEAGEVLIVENRNTCDENSPVEELTAQQINELRAAVQ